MTARRLATDLKALGIAAAILAVTVALGRGTAAYVELVALATGVGAALERHTFAPARRRRELVDRLNRSATHRPTNEAGHTAPRRPPRRPGVTFPERGEGPLP